MAASEVGGWVWPGNVRTALQYLSLWVGYQFDDTDWLAVENALPNTDADHPAHWYECPIVGSPSLTVLLAQNPGAKPVDIRVQGDLDDILATRIDTLLSILADLRPCDDA